MDSDLNLADEVDFIKKDIDFAVDFIDVSHRLPEKDGRIYINIQTKEKDRFCVELSSSGFKVGLQFFKKTSRTCNAISGFSSVPLTSTLIQFMRTYLFKLTAKEDKFSRHFQRDFKLTVRVKS